MYLILITTLGDGNLIVPLLHMGKQKHREVKTLAQDHTAGKWQKWDSNPGHSGPWFTVPTIPLSGCACSQHDSTWDGVRVCLSSGYNNQIP